MMLKRSLFLGIVLCLSSVQYLADPNIPNAVFLIPLVIGIAQCVLSFRYQKKYYLVLKIILITEAVYYLSALVYLIFAIADVSIKIFGCFIAVCMLAIIASSIYSIAGNARR